MKYFSVAALFFALSGNANAADVQVSSCAKDANILKVQISGESALNLFKAISKRLGLSPAKVRNFDSNGMRCVGTKFTQEGDVFLATCSYLMMAQENVPYPQTDPGFSGEKVVCD